MRERTSSALWGARVISPSTPRSPEDPQIVSILVATDISSAGVGILGMRTATTPLPTGNCITRAYWYIKYEYSVQQHQVYAMLIRGRTWSFYVLVYLVGYRPTAVCTDFISWMGGLIRHGPCHGVTCGIRMSFCWKLR